MAEDKPKFENKIKNLKPRTKKPGSKGTFQGYFNVDNSIKYGNKNEPCIYRSGLELKFFSYFENTPDYSRWESEPAIKIPYEFGGKIRSYSIDVIATSSSTGRWYFEIKPFTQSVKPKRGKSEKSYQYQSEQFSKNIAKWTAAKKFAEAQGARFAVLTEKFFM
jgi:hypothetical protein